LQNFCMQVPALPFRRMRTLFAILGIAVTQGNSQTDEYYAPYDIGRMGFL